MRHPALKFFFATDQTHLPSCEKNNSLILFFVCYKEARAEQERRDKENAAKKQKEEQEQATRKNNESKDIPKKTGNSTSAKPKPVPEESDSDTSDGFTLICKIGGYPDKQLKSCKPTDTILDLRIKIEKAYKVLDDFVDKIRVIFQGIKHWTPTNKIENSVKISILQFSGFIFIVIDLLLFFTFMILTIHFCIFFCIFVSKASL